MAGWRNAIRAIGMTGRQARLQRGAGSPESDGQVLAAEAAAWGPDPEYSDGQQLHRPNNYRPVTASSRGADDCMPAANNSMALTMWVGRALKRHSEAPTQRAMCGLSVAIDRSFKPIDNKDPAPQGRLYGGPVR